jgi:hypothetical protein
MIVEQFNTINLPLCPHALPVNLDIISQETPLERS